MNRWSQGRPTADGTIERGEAERVPASAEHAQAELVQARKHPASATLLLATDPVGAYSLAYDAAVTPEEAAGDLPKAQAIIDLAEKAMPHVGSYRPRNAQRGA